MTRGQCLCGAHRFRLEGELVLMHHCHCGYCRKSHGSAYGTVIGIDKDEIHWDARGDLISYRATEGYERLFCGHCGSPLPAASEDMPLFVPTGLLEGDFGHRAEFHMFVASKAPWYEIEDELPAFDAYPPGIDAPVSDTAENLDSATGVRGSCLCGDVRYVIDGQALVARHCHCERCRRARGAAHASNLVVDAGDFRWTAGVDSVREYKIPEARYFTQSFCGRCGSCVPRVDPERAIVVVPMGGLDDPPPSNPQEHIWVDAKAVWHDIHDDLPQHAEGPPGGSTRSTPGK
jgi:hypothetical protein